MIKFITILFCMFMFVSGAFSQTPTPTPGTPEEVYELICDQEDLESWVETNYDPVQTRRGEDTRPKDIIYQSATLQLAVICTYGYENNYYGDGSGDIRGLNCQGFIDIEAIEVAFNLFDLFVSPVYAASDKWKKVKAIKIKSYPQTKPAKPKKEKWKKEYGLKEKKEKFNGGGS